MTANFSDGQIEKGLNDDPLRAADSAMHSDDYLVEECSDEPGSLTDSFDLDVNDITLKLKDFGNKIKDGVSEVSYNVFAVGVMTIATTAFVVDHIPELVRLNTKPKVEKLKRSLKERVANFSGAISIGGTVKKADDVSSELEKPLEHKTPESAVEEPEGLSDQELTELKREIRDVEQLRFASGERPSVDQLRLIYLVDKRTKHLADSKLLLVLENARKQRQEVWPEDLDKMIQAEIPEYEGRLDNSNFKPEYSHYGNQPWLQDFVVNLIREDYDPEALKILNEKNILNDLRQLNHRVIFTEVVKVNIDDYSRWQNVVDSLEYLLSDAPDQESPFGNYPEMYPDNAADILLQDDTMVNILEDAIHQGKIKDLSGYVADRLSERARGETVAKCIHSFKDGSISYSTKRGLIAQGHKPAVYMNRHKFTNDLRVGRFLKNLVNRKSKS